MTTYLWSFITCVRPSLRVSVAQIKSLYMYTCRFAMIFNVVHRDYKAVYESVSFIIFNGLFHLLKTLNEGVSGIQSYFKHSIYVHTCSWCLQNKLSVVFTIILMFNLYVCVLACVCVYVNRLGMMLTSEAPTSYCKNTQHTMSTCRVQTLGSRSYLKVII